MQCPLVQADRDGEGSPTESCMSMDSIPLRKRSRKPKHVYNAADVAPLQTLWKGSTLKPKKVWRYLSFFMRSACACQHSLTGQAFMVS